MFHFTFRFKINDVTLFLLLTGFIVNLFISILSILFFSIYGYNNKHRFLIIRIYMRTSGANP